MQARKRGTQSQPDVTPRHRYEAMNWACTINPRQRGDARPLCRALHLRNVETNPAKTARHMTDFALSPGTPPSKRSIIP